MSDPAGVVAVAEGLTADIFHQLLDLAIDGKGRLRGARATAGRLIGKHRDAEIAVGRAVTEHIALAGGQGFATNWGGFVMSMVTIPANLAAATFVQARMVATVAHLRGYDVTDPRVRSAILMVMLGPAQMEALVAQGVLPSTPLAVATAPVFDAALDGRITRALLDRTMGHLGGKRLGVLAGRWIPFIGGGVGAVVDGLSTRAMAALALQEFPSRRPRLTSWKTSGATQPT